MTKGRISDTVRKELELMGKAKRKKSSTVYRIVIVLLLAVIAFSLYKIGTILHEYHVGTEEYEKVQSAREPTVPLFPEKWILKRCLRQTKMSRLGSILKTR